MFVNAGPHNSGIDTGDIPASLRFRNVASAYLSKTIGAGGQNSKHVMSAWVKPTVYSNYKVIYMAYVDANNYCYVYFSASNQLAFYWLNAGVTRVSKVSTAVFRDPTSWYHIFFAQDTTLVSAEDRFQLWVNGSRITSWATNTNNGVKNETTPFGGPYSHRFGMDQSTGGSYIDGYLARIAVSWQPSTMPVVTDFGYFNSTINEWVSKSQSEVKAVVDAGGTNSFMLDFDDATSLTTLGYDKSSKGNNWTLNNFSLTAGTTYDHMLDVPGNSFATLNPLDKNLSLTAPSNANLTSVSAVGTHRIIATAPYMPDGSWYVEIHITAVGSCVVGIAATGVSLADGQYLGASVKAWGWASNGPRYTNGANIGSTTTYTDGDILGLAFNATTRTLTGYKNGGSAITLFGPLSADTYFFAVSTYISDLTLNFGQRPFTYTPPTGFLALCQANLPDIDPASLLDPTDHHIDIAVTKSGDTNFTLPWNADTYDTFFEIKRRNAAGDWYQIDGLRGYDKILKSNSTAAETTDANVLGVSGTTCTLKSTLADGTYVISATKAGLSSARQTNTDGSITSTVSRNVVSGFSIVTYTGTGANATVGHGLGVAPKLVIVKQRSSGTTENWIVYHESVGATKYLYLNTTASAGTDSGAWNNTAPTSTVFTVNTWFEANESTKNFVAYCYADSAIQKSFSYTGNGSADGPYVNLGFKCGRTLLKRTDAAGYAWNAFDSARNSSNVVTSYVQPNDSVAEGSFSTMDFISNCLKLRASDASFNASGGTYIGHAWAAVAGKYSLAR